MPIPILRSSITSSKNPRRFHRTSLVFFAAAATCAQFARTAAAQSWTAGNGNWDTASNWNSGAGPVPGSNAVVEIDNDDTTNRNITYNYPGSVTLYELYVDNDGGGVDTLLMNNASGTLLSVSSEEFIGDSGSSTLSGNGAVEQSLGTVSLGDIGSIVLGGGALDYGAYTLSGGTIANSSGGIGGENIGLSGDGNFVQTGGTNNINTLNIATFGNSVGEYTLSAGTLICGSEQFAGEGESEDSLGTGQSATFIQSGGTNTVGTGDIGTGGFCLGQSGTAFYTLSGGTLSDTTVLNVEYVGDDTTGSATFAQSGGLNTCYELGIAAYGTGVYSLNAGILSTSGGGEVIGYDTNATFVQNGGLNTLTGGGDLVLGSSFGGTALYSLNGGTLSCAGHEFVGSEGNGTFVQTGGINNDSGDFAIAVDSGSNGTFSLTGGTVNVSGSLYVGGWAFFGPGGKGVMDVSGGTLAISGELLVYNATAGTTLNFSGGIISATQLSTSGDPPLIDWTGGTFSLTSAISIDSNFALGNSVTVPYLGLLETSSTFNNNGTLDLDNGSISAGGAITNNGNLGGVGSILGSAGFTNAGQLSPSGVFTLANTGAISNTGNITATSAEVTLSGGNLANSGGISLAGSTISGSAQLNNTSSGIISGYGTISSTLTNSGQIVPSGGTMTVPAFTNNGTIAPAGASAGLAGGAIVNAGQINGSGLISNSITNDGQISPSGGVLTLSGTVTNTASGQIIATPGSEATITQGIANNLGAIILAGGAIDTGASTLTNASSTGAQISGYGVLETAGLTNNGAITFTGGATTVTGPVTNNGTIDIAYQPALFTGAVTNNGVIDVTSTTATFTGGYSGNKYISDPSVNVFQNNVTVTGSMTGGALDQFYMSSGTFTNQGTFTNAGLLQSSDTIVNTGVFTQTGTFNQTANLTNSGAATIGGTQNWAKGTTFTNTTGTAIFQSDAGSASAYDLNMNVTGGRVTLQTPQHWQGLNVSGPGVLDITNNHILISYTGADPVSSIAAYIKSGFNGGNWNGPGIISSSAQTLTNGLRYGVGWADGANGVVSGLSSGQIEIKYTLLGDANLDGVVNGSDFSILAANFGKGVTNWDQGNFLFTSSVNGSDFAALAANFGQGDSGADSGAAVPVSQVDITALDAFAIANNLPLPTIDAVPEPMMLTMAGSIAGAALMRRRRK